MTDTTTGCPACGGEDEAVTEHPQVLARALGPDVMVDAGLLEILTLTSELGCSTLLSCQAQPWPTGDDMVWIMFRSQEDLLHWLQAVERGTDGDLYESFFNAWDFHAVLVDRCANWEPVNDLDPEDLSPVRFGPPHFTLYASVRFPVTQLDQVVDALRYVVIEESGERPDT